jgi:hypothetical protein
MTRRLALIPVLILSLAVLACSVPAEPQVEQATALPPAPTESIAATEAPTAIPAAAEPTEITPTFVFGGITMYVPEGWGLVAGIHKPADPTEDANPYWILPERDEILFDHYPMGNNQGLAQLFIIPVSGFPGYNDSAAAEIDRLKQILAEKPDPASLPVHDPLPQLSILSAPQVFHSNVAYVDFRSGTGLRFVTMFSHDVRLINNSDLYYTFQGLTSDGQYVVAAIFPITSSVLPPDATMELGAEEALANDYDNYLNTTLDKLNNADPAGWSPGLDYLDQIIGTLKIEGPGE